MALSQKHTVKAGEIYLLDQPRLRSSGHPHFVVILDVQGDKVVANFMSSELSLFNDEQDIMLRIADAEFASTGLTKDTFVINQDYARVRIPAERLFDLRARPVGAVSGNFKKRIEDYSGYTF
jgi:hypothetical protein